MTYLCYNTQLRKLIKEIIRFGLVGGVSFIIDFLGLILLQEFFFKEFKNGVLIAGIISFSVSLIIHYFLATYWVFQDHNVKTGHAHATAGLLFAVTNIVGLMINEALLYVGVVVLTIHYIVVKLVGTAIVMVWNYTCQKFIIFRERGRI